VLYGKTGRPNIGVSSRHIPFSNSSRRLRWWNRRSPDRRRAAGV